MMAMDYDDPNFDWVAYGAAREVKPERELLRRAREEADGDAAAELLLWPKLFPHKGMIDPEVYDALVAGALDVAAYVANFSRQPAPGDSRGANDRYPTVKPLMFFNGADPHARANPAPKTKETKEALIGLIVANGDALHDPNRLTDVERRVALTKKFAPLEKGWRWDRYLKERGSAPRPETIGEAEERLVAFVRWKYSSASKERSEPQLFDEELCKDLIAVSFKDIEWNRDAALPYPYPAEWDT